MRRVGRSKGKPKEQTKRCEVADEPVVVLKSRPLKPGNGVEDINRDDSGLS